jgi:hypothetical protein
MSDSVIWFFVANAGGEIEKDKCAVRNAQRWRRGNRPASRGSLSLSLSLSLSRSLALSLSRSPLVRNELVLEQIVHLFREYRRDKIGSQ